MALVRTTLSSACAADDSSIVVASATSIAEGVQVLVDKERMVVTKAYVLASTTVPVLRGQEGTEPVAHPSGAGVVHGVASDFGSQIAQTTVQYPMYAAFDTRSYTASGAITLPKPGSNMVAILNGTSVLAMTIAVPTKDMDGCELTIMSNGAAAHTLTFSGGLSGAGSGYDVLTVNATAPVAHKFVASNSLWLMYSQAGISGTVTNIISALA